MGLNIEYIEVQTPLDEEEKEGLLITTISTRGELDEFEQANIQQAIEWTMSTRFTAEEILTENFLFLVHRIVKIHLFPNGNGRHSRLLADILISNIFKKPVFTWGRADLAKNNATRKAYPKAIHLADNENYKSLIEFV